MSYKMSSKKKKKKLESLVYIDEHGQMNMGSARPCVETSKNALNKHIMKVVMKPK